MQYKHTMLAFLQYQLLDNGARNAKVTGESG